MKYLEYLEEDCGYHNIKILPDGRWAAAYSLLFTASIIVGRLGDETGYDDRWCYHTFEDAAKALEAWDGKSEPIGWHRHPATGRRITEEGELVQYA